MNTQKQRWLLDASLFAGFLICFFLDLTGLSLHQWLGVIGGLAATYHLVTHWNWVSAVMERFFGKTSKQARLYYLLDAILLFSFTIIISTGLVISTWLNLSLTNYAAWHTLHILASIITLVALVVKILLHAGWIVNAARKIFAAPVPRSTALAPVAVPAGASSKMYRRDFLKLMGVVGVASLLAMSSSVDSLQAAAETQENTSSTAATSSSSASNLPSSSSSGLSDSSQSSSSACSVLCNRRCSYPGHCRRYTDSNSNGRCDLGECQA